MAKRPAKALRPASLTPSQSIEMLKDLRDKANVLLTSRPIDHSKKQAWEATATHVLERAFGSDSPNISAVVDVNRFAFAFGGGTQQQYEQQRVQDMQERVHILDGLIEMVEKEFNLTGLGNPDKVTINIPLPDMTKREASDHNVFLVHGHDHGAKNEIARFIERFGLAVTILHEEANAGRTTIEKFTDHANVDFAVVLMTADDRGGTFNCPFESQKLRARQNVILELGFFVGKLGRKRVCALRQEGVEIPSDYAGVLYIEIDDAGAWKMLLAREMKGAGLPIDMNLAN